MIFIGAVLVSRFEWILYIFGAFLLYTGIKMVKQGSDEEGEDLSQNKVLQWLQKHIRVGKSLNGEKFFTVENGKRVASPLLMVLIMVELSDVIFAVDSIPAIFAVTTDPFIVLTSNIFAILGLRAMYFLLARHGRPLRIPELRLGIRLELYRHQNADYSLDSHSCRHLIGSRLRRAWRIHPHLAGIQPENGTPLMTRYHR